MSAPERSAAPPVCDYLLVVGPGRSGSELLYRNLLAHPACVFPEVKEGYYYRSPARLRRARRTAGGKGAVLVDVANLGYRDPALVPGVVRLQDEGVRVLIVVLLREHGTRARSMMRFRRSRGEVSALFGARRLEAAVVRDRLTPERLQDLYRLNADVLVIHFSALVQRTAEVLDALTDRCGLARLRTGRPGRVNEAVQARSTWLAAAGKAAAVALRRLGFRRTLQRVKDDPRVRALFFVPLGPDDPARLGERSQAVLEEAWRECCAVVERHAERVADGVYLRPAPIAGPAAPRPG